MSHVIYYKPRGFHNPWAPWPVMEFKITVIGDYAVGKTSLIEQYVYNSFDRMVQPTIGMEHYKKELERKFRLIELNFWDTPGKMSALSTFPNFFRNADVIILVYDVTRWKTFEGLEKWLRVAKINAPRNALYFVVGSKCDLYDRVVFPRHSRNFSEEYNLLDYEVSAQKNFGIERLFDDMVDKLIKKDQRKNVQDRETIRVSEPRDRKRDAGNEPCCDS